MTFLLFQLGADWYAVEARRVVQVTPLVRLKALPQAPLGVAGVFSFREAPVPVLDLRALAVGQPSRPRLSTRILLVDYTPDSSGPRLLGLIAERATETMRREASDFTSPGVSADGTPYLGPVTSDRRGLIQWVEVDKLLSEQARAALFQPAAP